MEKTIHSRQIIFLQFLCILSTGLILPPAMMIKEAGPGVWISGGLIGNIAGFFVSIVLLLLAKKFPDKDPVEISGLLFGKVGRIVFGLMFTFFFIEVGFLALRELGEFIKDLLLPHTPLIFILFLTLLVGVYAVRSGLEVLGRMADFLMPIVLFSLLIILFFIVKSVDWKFLTPPLEKGWEGIIRGSIAPSLWSSEIFLGAMFLPALKQKNKKVSCFITPLITTGGLVAICLMITIGVLGGEMAGRLQFPFFFASSMGRSTLFEQLDVFVAAIWILGISLKTFTYYYTAAISLQKTFQVQSYKPFVFPLGLVIGVLSYTFVKNDIDLFEFFQLPKLTSINFLFFTMVLPFLLLLGSVLRRVKQ